jgi:hypothetical protein
MDGSVATGSYDGVEAVLGGCARLLPRSPWTAGWLKLSLDTGGAQHSRSPLHQSKAAGRILP